jgi:hypothetical protein
MLVTQTWNGIVYADRIAEASLVSAAGAPDIATAGKMLSRGLGESGFLLAGSVLTVAGVGMMLRNPTPRTTNLVVDEEVSTSIEEGAGAPRVAPNQSQVPLPNPGETDMAYGSRVHQEFPRIMRETNPGVGGRYNVQPGLTGPDLEDPTRMNANYAEMKSLWGRQRDMLQQARNWGYDAQSARYFFYDRNTGRVFEGIIQTDKFPSGRFR